MKSKDKQTAQILAYAGSVPFVLLSLALIMKSTAYDYELILRAYSAVIISFLCGIHWAVYMLFSDKCTRNLLLRSNAITLIAWSSLLFNMKGFNLIIQLLCFIYLLWLDHELMKRQIVLTWFYNVRRNVTCLVCSSLMISACIL